MIQTSIIIPVSNKSESVKDCIDHLIRYTNNYEIVFVIDDSMNPAMKSYLARYGSVKTDPEAFIFAKRINIGIASAKGDYICILNDDVLVSEEWLDRMIKVSRIMGPAIIGARCQAGGCHNPDANGPGPIIHTDHTVNMFATLIPRRVIDVMGPLDERFIHYGGEDCDYTLRARRNGFKTVISDAVVYHKKSASFGQGRIADELPLTREIFTQKWGERMPLNRTENWADEKRSHLSMPLVSVLMATRNHEAYIGEAVRSVLCQTYPKLQLIIGVDGPGQEKTFEILRHIKDEILDPNRIEVREARSHIGFCNMRNICFKHAAGEYIAIMDSDDIMLPDRLKDELEAMDQYTDIIHSGYTLMGVDGKKYKAASYPVNRELLLHMREGVSGGTFLARRHVFEKESFSERYYRAADFEFTLRTIGRFNYKHIDKPTIIYRRHPGEHLSGNKDAVKMHEEIVKGYQCVTKA